MRRGIIISDRHHDEKEEFHPAYLLVKQFAKEWNPDFVVDLGDTLDLSYFSSFNKEDVSLLGNCNWEKDVELLRREDDEWLEICSDFTRLQGNHDYRAEKMGDKIPAFRQSLDYEWRFNVAKNGIKYVRELDQPLRVGKLNLLHGWWCNKYHAAKHVAEYSGNCCYGHVHKFQSESKVLHAQDKAIMAQSLGCLCDLNPEWLRGRPANWQHGFGIVYLQDNGNFNLYGVTIVDGIFIWEGREWKK